LTRDGIEYINRTEKSFEVQLEINSI